jgi:ElaB/YqjD/DUF883 family membrane-anchored ribosome-binding protein
MDSFITSVQRIQKDLHALSNELDEVLREHSPQTSTEQIQVILPARKRGRPKKADAEAREAVKEVQKAEEAANELVAVVKPTKKLKSSIPVLETPKKLKTPTPPLETPSVKICRTCGIDLTLGADHRSCFFTSGFPSSDEWTQDCIVYAREIGAGVAYVS